MTMIENGNKTILEKHLRKDGWSNFFSGIGKRGKDKTESNDFNAGYFFDDKTLTDIYMFDGLGAAIIDRPADDMTRNWFNIAGDDKGEIQEELKRLKAHTSVNQAIKWARLYRGCIVQMVFEGDRTEFETPAPEKIKGIKFLRIYSAARIPLSPSNINNNPKSEYFDEIEVFPVQTKQGSIMNIHESRCLVFKGLPIPDSLDYLDFQYLYWGLPVLSQVYDRLSNYGVVEKGINNLLQEASIGKYTLAGLASYLAQNDEASIQKIYDRLDIIDTCKSLINAVLLGDGEAYERDTVNLSGIEGIIDRSMMNLSAVSRIPVSLLFGRSPAGQNATGESDFRSYYDMVSSEQDTWLYYPLKKLVDNIAKYKKVINPQINFNPLKEANEKENAEIRKYNTESDKLDMEMGLYMAEDILKRRGEQDGNV